MIRELSGLDPDLLSTLKLWESLFHEEVHGAMLTRFFEFSSEGQSTIAPKPKVKPIAMLMNRFCEVCWMLHRTLPIIQLSQRRFNKKWGDKWHLLDANFRAMEQGLANSRKKMGTVFIEFMGIKFPFGPEVCFDTQVSFP